MAEGSSDENKGVHEIAAVALQLATGTPEMKAAGRQVGKAILTVTTCVNSFLLPLAAVNFAADKARRYFSEKFAGDMADRAKDIPGEFLVEPAPNLAGPALQGLAFCHETMTLKDMYLALLATGMDSRTTDDAHPSFVDIVRQLTAEEARLLPVILKAKGLPIGEIRRVDVRPPANWSTLYRHLLDLRESDTNEAVENTRLPVMVDNWVRLGLVDVTYDKHLTSPSAYDNLNARPELARLKADNPSDEATIKVQPGIIFPTAFGRQFGKAAGLFDSASPDKASSV